MSGFLLVQSASAHEEVIGVRNTIDAVDPPLPGVTIQVRISVADQLLVANPTHTELAVLGEQKEPFLRIGSDGAFANLRSPTWYRSNDPTGAIPVPPRADASAAPEWVHIAREPAWGWFDHRLHRVQLTAAPPVAGPVTLERWTVPMRYGDRDVVVRGRREFRRVRGGFRSEITEQIPGAEATVVPGPVPGIFLRMTGAETVTLFEDGNVPFARIGPSGAEANEASATWALTAEARTGTPPRGDIGKGVTPRWQRQGSRAQLFWLEPRARYPADEPPASVVDARRTVVVRRWSVPVRVGDDRHELAGTTRWIPTHPVSGGGSTLRIALFGGLGAAVVAALVVARRRRKS